MLQPAARRACIHERVREWEGMKGCRQCYAHCPHHTARTSLLMYTILGSPGTLSRRHVSAPAEATDPSPEVLVWQWPTVTVPTLRWASQPSLDLPTLTMVVLTCSSHSTASAAAAPCTREYRAGPAVGAQPAAANRGNTCCPPALTPITELAVPPTAATVYSWRPVLSASFQRSRTVLPLAHDLADM